MRHAMTMLTLAALAVAAFAGGTQLSGVVKDQNGKPMADVLVRMAPTDRSKGYRPVQARTDAKGAFALQTEETGSHTVSVQSVKKGDSFSATLPDIEVKGDEQKVTLQLSKCAISGKVVCKDTKKSPGDRENVALYRVKPWGMAGMAFLGEKGKYCVRGFPPGKYRLIVSVKGYRRVTQDIEIKKGKKKKGVDFVLEPLKAGRVEFTVKDGEGNPLAGARFSYSTGPSMSSTLRVTPTEDVPGHYVCTQLEEGTWQVYVSHPAWQGKGMTVEVTEGKTTKVEVNLTPK